MMEAAAAGAGCVARRHSLAGWLEAHDSAGVMDEDFDASVLVEGDPQAHALRDGDEPIGKLDVQGSVGKLKLKTKQSGNVVVRFRDGSFAGLAPPPPLRVFFFGGAPSKMAIVADGAAEATAGEPLLLRVEARDEHDNVSAMAEGRRC